MVSRTNKSFLSRDIYFYETIFPYPTTTCSTNNNTSPSYEPYQDHILEYLDNITSNNTTTPPNVILAFLQLLYTTPCLP